MAQYVYISQAEDQRLLTFRMESKFRKAETETQSCVSFAMRSFE